LSELWQDRKRTHGPRQSLSWLGDALHISIAEKLGGLRQVRDTVGSNPMSRAQVKSVPPPDRPT